MSQLQLTLSLALVLLLAPMGSLRLSADNATNSPDGNTATATASGNAYIHGYTGFTFPLNVGPFKRVQVTPFNANASDVGIDYNNDPLTAHVSVNIYPAKGPLQAHYQQCRDQVAQVHPDAKLVEEKPVTLNKAGATYNGYSALFTFQGKFAADTAQELLSKLLVFRYGDYFVTYRVSYTGDNRAANEKLIDDFIQNLDWPPPTPATPLATPSTTPLATPPAPSTTP